MKCPECGSSCDRDEVDVGVGVICSAWVCSGCGWDEDQAFPMTQDDWQKYMNEGWEVGLA